MILKRLIAFPESRKVLAIQLLGTPFWAVHMGVVAMIPVMLRKQFAASELETTIATAAIPVMLMLSIFWNEVYRRLSPQRYLALFWLLAFVPLGLIGLCSRSETVLVCFLLSCLGVAGVYPLHADILRSCYPPSVRSRVHSVQQMIAFATAIAITFGVGIWLDIDNRAYRIYFPLSTALLGVSVLLIRQITRQPLFKERLKHHPTEPFIASLRNAFKNMFGVLRDDPVFRRYETAFFIYGLGWMICAAILPFLVVDVLKLNYGQVAQSTQVTLQVVMLMLMLPAGYLMDKLGPVRLASWAFAAIALYPIGLLLAGNVFELTLATVLFGIGISGVHLAWTLGPVVLPQNASHAPHYMAIHTTLVGSRALIGQFPAVLLYKLTGDIRIPLVAAFVLFAAGALMMSRLERQRRATQKPAAIPVAAIPD